MPAAGFAGPVSELNRTTGSYPGSVRTRFSERKPQSHAYAPLTSVLHYNPGQGDLVGGNFWDLSSSAAVRSISTVRWWLPRQFRGLAAIPAAAQIRSASS
jgi:hypothetical protein